MFLCGDNSILTRSKESLEEFQAVVMSLLFCWGYEWVANEIVALIFAGVAENSLRQGRCDTPAKSDRSPWKFDPTKGCAGQDTHSWCVYLLAQPHHS